MSKKVGAVGVIALFAVLGVVLPARAVVIEDIVKNHPIVAWLNGWNSSAGTAAPGSLSNVGDTSAEPQGLPAANSPAVSRDNMTVEIVPIRLPTLPAHVAFALYLVGALVFYTLLVLIAQPGPAEYY
ncbi:MAG: hypothetical protein K6U75_04440 [Firmicutes bacterium]|nr:hypothetical protein [Bacillota bacterium]